MMQSPVSIVERLVSNVLSARAITKIFGPTTALDNVSVDFVPGTVHALMGANGSGKSTLTKALVGVLSPDQGEVWLGNTELKRARVREQGIVAVFQETSLVPEMSVEDNIWLTREPRNVFGIDRNALRQQTVALIDLIKDVAPNVRPETPVSALGPDSRQLVELLKAVSRDPRFIVLDEATASLDGRQAARVAELVDTWRRQNRCVILVTHRMHEAFALADTISVLRNGKLMATGARSALDEAQVVDLMVGVAGRRAPGEERAPVGDAATALSATVATGRSGNDFVLQVRKGEIVGLAGLQGQGQATVLRGLFSGDSRITALEVSGRPTRITQPADALRAHLAFVPGDRNRDGLLKSLSVSDNMLAASWSSHAKWGWLDLAGAQRTVKDLIARLRVKTASTGVAVSTLSGGNAQKIVLARWLATQPEVLLLDDPTKGIDVNARADFYEALEQARGEGMAS